MPESTALMFGIGTVFVYLCCYGLAIAEYVIRSLALYRIAKKREIQNAWLSWIPVGYAWIVGRTTEEIDRERGINRKWGIVLLTVGLVILGLAVLTLIACIAFAVIVLMNELFVDEIGVYMIFVLYGFIVLLLIPTSLFGALQIVCFYKIFEFNVPEKSLKYMIVSMLVPLGLPLCLLKCSRICPEKPMTAVSFEE